MYEIILIVNTLVYGLENTISSQLKTSMKSQAKLTPQHCGVNININSSLWHVSILAIGIAETSKIAFMQLWGEKSFFRPAFVRFVLSPPSGQNKYYMLTKLKLVPPFC